MLSQIKLSQKEKDRKLCIILTIYTSTLIGYVFQKQCKRTQLSVEFLIDNIIYFSRLGCPHRDACLWHNSWCLYTWKPWLIFSISNNSIATALDQFCLWWKPSRIHVLWKLFSYGSWLWKYASRMKYNNSCECQTVALVFMCYKMVMKIQYVLSLQLTHTTLSKKGGRQLCLNDLFKN